MGVYLYQNNSELTMKNAYIGEYVPPYLCFTANEANSTVQMRKVSSPTVLSFEKSTDGTNWTDYNIASSANAQGDIITLTNVGDKVYFRNKSETPTKFSSINNYYYFRFVGSIAASGDITYLLCKNGTTTLTGDYCFTYLFANPYDKMTSCPRLPATTLTNYCYSGMFMDQNQLATLPELPATTLPNNCYYQMFYGCSNIKLSATQTGIYQTAYRIPASGTGTDSSGTALSYMFQNTGGTFKPTPNINTTYYTSNTVV